MDLSQNYNYLYYRYVLLLKEVSPTSPVFFNPRPFQIMRLETRVRWNLDPIETAIAKDMLNRFGSDKNLYLYYYEVGQATIAF